MKTDRELLELAARAAGLHIKADRVDADDRFTHFVIGAKNTRERTNWNPLTDDGDALRLAVKLRITVGPESHDVIGRSLSRASWNDRTMSLGEYGDGDPFKATRRAIVRAAAEIQLHREKA